MECIEPAVINYCTQIKNVIGVVAEPPRHAFKRTIKSGRFSTGLENTTLPLIRDSEGKVTDMTCEGCPAEDTEDKRAYRIQKLAMCLNNMQAAIDHLDDMRGVMKEACMATGAAKSNYICSLFLLFLLFCMSLSLSLSQRCCLSMRLLPSYLALLDSPPPSHSVFVSPALHRSPHFVWQVVQNILLVQPRPSQAIHYWSKGSRKSRKRRTTTCTKTSKMSLKTLA